MAIIVLIDCLIPFICKRSLAGVDYRIGSLLADKAKIIADCLHIGNSYSNSFAVFWIKADDRYLQYAHDYRTTIFHHDFREHLQATYQLKDVSTAERFYRWIAGVRMIKDNALTGYGPNTFYNNYKPYAVPAFKTWVSDNKEHSTVHNYFLLIAIEQGIPGLLFFLLLCWRHVILCPTYFITG